MQNTRNTGLIENRLLQKPALIFDDKEISGYIYLNNHMSFKLGNHEYDIPFLCHVLSEENLRSLMNIYLNVLEKLNLENFNKLKHEDGFEAEEVMESLSNDLKTDLNKYMLVLKICQEKINAKYLKDNPLDQLLENTFLKVFCDGLNFTKTERSFFILNLLNKDWNWLFPETQDNNYKAKLFCQICGISTKGQTILARKLNNKFINLGLFTSEWETADFVYAFFIRNNSSFSLEKIHCQNDCDFYDYKEMEEINKDNLKIMLKEIYEYQKKKEGCFQIIQSENDFRNKNFFAFLAEEMHFKVYEIKQEISYVSQTEFFFYLYAFSIELKNQNAVILLNNSLAETFLLDEKFFLNISSDVLKKIKIPVIISLNSFDDCKKNILQKNGIDILYTVKLCKPERINHDLPLNYYCRKKVPEHLIALAVNKSLELKIEPEEWIKVSSILRHAARLTDIDVCKILEQKYKPFENENLRSNQHFCFEALNTSVPIKEITQTIQNAEKYQSTFYDADSGIRILLEGKSGTGKTAYVEEVAKMLNKKLITVRASEILSPYVGETEQNIKAAFENAKKEHAILLIDEADSFIHARGDNINHHNDLKVNEFLVQMERFPGILFCNTNLAENLDKASDRRFHYTINFKPLSKEGVKLLCSQYFKSFNLSSEQIEKIFNSGDVTPGDFGALNGRLKFLNLDSLDSKYITDELCKTVQAKSRSWEKQRIGF